MTLAVAELAAVEAESDVDAAAFSSWMAAEQRRIFLLCVRLLRDRDEADSATQDTFLKAYRAFARRPAGDVGDEAAKWLTRIAVNTCLDRLRSNRWRFWRRRPRGDDEETILMLAPAAGPRPDDLVFAREIARRVTAALERLSPRQRSVFVLRHDEDRSLEEIAELVGIDLGTVKAHLARALKKLREELRDLYGHQALD